LLNFSVFKSSFKYISYSFMVHLHVIEFWVENKCCSLRIFDLMSPIIIFINNFTHSDIDAKVPQRLYLIIFIFFFLTKYSYSCIKLSPFLINVCSNLLPRHLNFKGCKKLPWFTISWTFYFTNTLHCMNSQKNLKLFLCMFTIVMRDISDEQIFIVVLAQFST